MKILSTINPSLPDLPSIVQEGRRVLRGGNNKGRVGREALGEAFMLGKSQMIAEKLFAIIGRKIGKEQSFSDYATEYTNKDGKFYGYYGTIGGELTRINFLIGGNEQIFSVDLFGKGTAVNLEQPRRTIFLLGSNVVHVINQIVDVFNGDFATYNEDSYRIGSKRLQEAVHHIDILEEFLKLPENKNLLKDVSEQRANLKKVFEAFADFCRNNYDGRKPPKHEGALLYLMKRYAKERINVKIKIPSVEVKRGKKEKPINTDKKAEEAYETLNASDPIMTFRILEMYMARLAGGDQTADPLYLYGQGGIGKSYLAKKYLAPLGHTEYITGKIKGYSGLVEVLYQNKEGKIIVLDDTMTKEDMKNTSVENILKAALDPDEPRRIMLLKKPNAKEKAGAETVEDRVENEIDNPVSEESETDFHFNSKVVFITNYEDVPQALQDRCSTLRMIYSNEEVLKIIETNVLKISPAHVPEAKEIFTSISGLFLDDDNPPMVKPDQIMDQRAVLEFLRSQSKAGLIKRTLSIRLFKKALSLYVLTKNSPYWRDVVMTELA